MSISKGLSSKERRPLNEFEVRQIAGRAGRRGMYDVGYVTATTEAGLEHIKRVYPMKHSIEYAIIGFPQVLLDIDQPIDQILTSWYVSARSSRVSPRTSSKTGNLTDTSAV